MAVLLYVIFDKAPAAQASGTVPQNLDLSVTGLANYLFVHQLVNLELAGVMLTMAMVGAIVVARRRLWSPGARPQELVEYDAGDDNPHHIEITGTDNPKQKEYPEA
jgi:NADH-quinone oxidoreductase subunit J